MKTYKITNPRILEELANKTRKTTLVSSVIVVGLIISITFFLILKDDAKIAVIPLTLGGLLFIVLFGFMFKQVNGMLYKLNKYRFVIIDNNSVTIGTSKEFKEELNFIQKYFYNRVNRFGTYSNKTFLASKIKSIKEKKRGIQIKVSGVVGNFVMIPKEMDNILEIKQEITKMIKP